MSRAFTFAALAFLLVVVTITLLILAPRLLVVLALTALIVGLVLKASAKADRANHVKRDSTRGF